MGLGEFMLSGHLPICLLAIGELIGVGVLLWMLGPILGDWLHRGLVWSLGHTGVRKD